VNGSWGGLYAGTPNPGDFLKLDRQMLQATLRLNTMAHLDVTHHFGAKLAERRRGGLILIGSVGAEIWGSAPGE
jgi:short-subunit dehydrogenase